MGSFTSAGREFGSDAANTAERSINKLYDLMKTVPSVQEIGYHIRCTVRTCVAYIFFVGLLSALTYHAFTRPIENPIFAGVIQLACLASVFVFAVFNPQQVSSSRMVTSGASADEGHRIIADVGASASQRLSHTMVPAPADDFVLPGEFNLILPGGYEVYGNFSYNGNVAIRGKHTNTDPDRRKLAATRLGNGMYIIFLKSNGMQMYARPVSANSYVRFAAQDDDDNDSQSRREWILEPVPNATGKYTLRQSTDKVLCQWGGHLCVASENLLGDADMHFRVARNP